MLQIDETLWCHIWLNFRNFLTFWYTTGRLTSSTSLEVSTATKQAYITMFWNACCTNWNICYFFSKICIKIVSHWWWLGCFGTCLFVKSNVQDHTCCYELENPHKQIFRSDQKKIFVSSPNTPASTLLYCTHLETPSLSLRVKLQTRCPTSKINPPSLQTKTNHQEHTYVASPTAILLALTCVHLSLDSFTLYIGRSDIFFGFYNTAAVTKGQLKVLQ